MKTNTLSRSLSVAALCALSTAAHADLSQWITAVNAGTPHTYLNTNLPLQSTIDIGALSGDITYEFVVNAGNRSASMSLLGSLTGGQDEAIKFNQFNDTGNYGVTHYGFADFNFGVPNTFGSDVVLAFVANSGAGTTALFVNGVDTGTTVPFALTLQGNVGIGGTDFGAGYFDNFDGSILGFTAFDSALSASEIQAHANGFFAGASVPEPGTVALLVGMGIGGIVLRRRK